MFLTLSYHYSEVPLAVRMQVLITHCILFTSRMSDIECPHKETLLYTVRCCKLACTLQGSVKKPTNVKICPTMARLNSVSMKDHQPPWMDKRFAEVVSLEGFVPPCLTTDIERWLLVRLMSLLLPT